MNAKHTPGPWTNQGYGPKTNYVGVKDFLVAKVYDAGHKESVDSVPTDTEGEANYRLIIAAPDLLAALREIATINYLNRGNSNISGAEEMQRIAGAAVAKAEGR